MSITSQRVSADTMIVFVVRAAVVHQRTYGASFKTICEWRGLGADLVLPSIAPESMLRLRSADRNAGYARQGELSRAWGHRMVRGAVFDRGG